MTIDGVCGVMAAISASGTDTRTFTRVTSMMVTTACEGMAVSPAFTCWRPMMPLTGAFSWQSARFFLATANCDRACATLLCISTHWASGSEPASCNMP